MHRNDIPGIYAIECARTGKLYIGSSVGIWNRWDQHRYALKRGTHHAQYLQRAWNKYGAEAFRLLVLEPCEPVREILLAREQAWLDGLCPDFNHCLTAGSRLGVPLSSEAREKIRQAHKGKQFSDEHRAAISTARKASTAAAAQLLAARAARTPESHTTGHDKLRGRKRPPEVIAKMSAALTGRKLSAEHLATLSALRTGHPVTDETRAKIRTALQGRPGKGVPRGSKRSPEVGARIAASLQSSTAFAEYQARRRGQKRDPAIGAKISATKLARRQAMLERGS